MRAPECIGPVPKRAVEILARIESPPRRGVTKGDDTCNDAGSIAEIDQRGETAE